MIKNIRIQIVFVALVLMPLVCAHHARAQAVPTATSPGSFIAVGGTYAIYQTQYGKQVLGGVGVHLDLNFTLAIGLEGEVRWLRQGQVADTHQTTYLIGPRYQRVIHNGPFKPYAKFLVGDGDFNFPYNYQKGEYLVIAPGAGLEFRVNESLSVRVIDFEYQRWPQFTYGPISPYGVSFGFTYRIFGGERWESSSRHPPLKRD